MNKFDFKVRFAFTLAETLITLAIIGVVAVLTIPILVTNINQNVFASAQDLALKKIHAACDQMRTDDLITSGYTNDSFADQFQKYIKVVKRCDSSHLQDCFSSTFQTASGDNINLSNLNNGIALGQAGNSNALVGLNLINGTTMLLAFNPTCQSVNPYNNGIDTTSCIAAVYDVNGFGKPNQMGKDIYPLNATITACDGKKIGSLCVDIADASFTPISADPYFSNDNYWAGADKACSDLGKRLPTQSELDTMYTNRASIGGFSANWYWSTSASQYNGWAQHFGSGAQNNHNKNYDTFKARCVK